MPKYHVEDQATGRSYVLEGDSPPTETELHDIFQQQSGPGIVQNLKNTLGKAPEVGRQLWEGTKGLLRKPGELIHEGTRQLGDLPTEIHNRALAAKQIGLKQALSWPSEQIEQVPGTTLRAFGGGLPEPINLPIIETEKVPGRFESDPRQQASANPFPGVGLGGTGVDVSTPRWVPEHTEEPTELAGVYNATAKFINEMGSRKSILGSVATLNPVGFGAQLPSMIAETPENYVEQSRKLISGSPSERGEAGANMLGRALMLRGGKHIYDEAFPAKGPRFNPQGAVPEVITQGSPEMPFTGPLGKMQRFESSPKGVQDLNAPLPKQAEPEPLTVQANVQQGKSLHSGIDREAIKRLLPAIKVGSRLLVGKQGESHDEVLKANGVDPEMYPHVDPARGFVDSRNPDQLIARRDAEAMTGLKGTAKAGGLDSQDLPKGERHVLQRYLTSIRDSGLKTLYSEHGLVPKGEEGKTPFIVFEKPNEAQATRIQEAAQRVGAEVEVRDKRTGVYFQGGEPKEVVQDWQDFTDHLTGKPTPKLMSGIDPTDAAKALSPFLNYLPTRSGRVKVEPKAIELSPDDKGVLNRASLTEDDLKKPFQQLLREKKYLTRNDYPIPLSKIKQVYNKFRDQQKFKELMTETKSLVPAKTKEANLSPSEKQELTNVGLTEDDLNKPIHEVIDKIESRKDTELNKRIMAIYDKYQKQTAPEPVDVKRTDIDVVNELGVFLPGRKFPGGAKYLKDLSDDFLVNFYRQSKGVAKRLIEQNDPEGTVGNPETHYKVSSAWKDLENRLLSEARKRGITEKMVREGKAVGTPKEYQGNKFQSGIEIDPTKYEAWASKTKDLISKAYASRNKTGSEFHTVTLPLFDKLEEHVNSKPDFRKIYEQGDVGQPDTKASVGLNSGINPKEVFDHIFGYGVKRPVREGLSAIAAKQSGWSAARHVSASEETGNRLVEYAAADITAPIYSKLNPAFDEALYRKNSLNAWVAEGVKSGVYQKVGKNQTAPVMGDKPAVQISFGPGKSYWVRADLVPEVNQALHGTGKVGRAGMQFLLDVATEAQIIGPTDFVFHTGNMFSSIVGSLGAKTELGEVARRISGVKQLDAVGRIGYSLYKTIVDSPKVQAELAEISRIGALRADVNHTSLLSKATGGLLDTGKWIKQIDRAGRLARNQMFDNLVKRDLVRDTELDRREFINKMGQYNEKLMSKFQAFQRQYFSQFVVAGRTFNRNAFQRLMLSNEVRAASPEAYMKMKLYNMVGLVSTLFAIPIVFNCILNGNPFGRSGTPVGKIDTGKDNDDGSHIVIDLGQTELLRRGLRNSGAQALAKGLLEGQPVGKTAANMAADIVKGQLQPWLGPPLRMAGAGIMEYAKDRDMAASIKAATLAANPTVSRYFGADEGQSGVSGVAEQLGGSLGYGKTRLPKHEEKVQKLIGKTIENTDFVDRLVAEHKLKAGREKMTPETEARVVGKNILNFKQRGIELRKSLSKNDRQWFESRGLEVPGFDNKLKVAKEELYLSEREMVRFTELHKVATELALERLKPIYDILDDDDRRKTKFSETFSKYHKVAREEMLKEIKEGYFSQNEQDKKKKFNFWDHLR